MIVRWRQQTGLTGEQLDLAEQELHIPPVADLHAAGAVRQPARARIAKTVDQKLHVRRLLTEHTASGIGQGAPKQEVGHGGLLCAVADCWMRQSGRR